VVVLLIVLRELLHLVLLNQGFLEVAEGLDLLRQSLPLLRDFLFKGLFVQFRLLQILYAQFLSVHLHPFVLDVSLVGVELVCVLGDVLLYLVELLHVRVDLLSQVLNDRLFAQVFSPDLLVLLALPVFSIVQLSSDLLLDLLQVSPLNFHLLPIMLFLSFVLVDYFLDFLSHSVVIIYFLLS